MSPAVATEMPTVAGLMYRVTVPHIPPNVKVVSCPSTVEVKTDCTFKKKEKKIKGHWTYADWHT